MHCLAEQSRASAQRRVGARSACCIATCFRTAFHEDCAAQPLAMQTQLACGPRSGLGVPFGARIAVLGIQDGGLIRAPMSGAVAAKCHAARPVALPQHHRSLLTP
jgi:hypothetical protein